MELCHAPQMAVDTVMTRHLKPVAVYTGVVFQSRKFKFSFYSHKSPSTTVTTVAAVLRNGFFVIESLNI